MSDGLADGLRSLDRTCGEERCHHRDRFTAHNGSRRFIFFNVVLALDPFAFQRLSAPHAQLVKVRSLVHDGRVVICDVRDVDGLSHDRDVPLLRNNGALQIFVSDIFVGNENVFAGVDIIIAVGPLPDAGAALEASFRWERSPTDMLIALAP